MRRRRGRKRARGTRSPMPIPIRPTIRWSLDPRHCHSDQWRSIGSISDTFGASRKFRILAVNDDCARENLCLIADTSISGARVARELTALIRIYGKPDCIVSELPLLRHWSKRQWRRHRVHQPGDPQMGWRYRCRLALHRSGPIAGKTIPVRGKPVPRTGFCSPSPFSGPAHTQQNGLIESFNGSLRDECLNEEIFDSLADARQTLALWRYDYNNVRPHSSLGNLTPVEARRTLALNDGSAPAALAQTENDGYQTSRLSL